MTAELTDGRLAEMVADAEKHSGCTIVLDHVVALVGEVKWLRVALGTGQSLGDRPETGGVCLDGISREIHDTIGELLLHGDPHAERMLRAAIIVFRESGRSATTTDRDEALAAADAMQASLAKALAEVERMRAERDYWVARTRSLGDTLALGVMDPWRRAHEIGTQAMTVGLEECERLRAEIARMRPVVEASIVAADDPYLDYTSGGPKLREEVAKYVGGGGDGK